MPNLSGLQSVALVANPSFNPCHPNIQTNEAHTHSPAISITALSNLHSPSSPSHIQIIPDEDPQRLVELDKEEEDEGEGEDPGFSRDGIGVDDKFDVDQDELGDEVDPFDKDGEPQDDMYMCSHHACPVWLLEASKAKVAESVPEKRDSNGLPPLYSKNCSMWFSRAAI